MIFLPMCFTVTSSSIYPGLNVSLFLPHPPVFEFPPDPLTRSMQGFSPNCELFGDREMVFSLISCEA